MDEPGSQTERSGRMRPDTLRRWRGHMGLTQGAAADMLGVGRRTYNAYERGTSPIPTLVAWACVGALGLADVDEGLRRLDRIGKEPPGRGRPPKSPPFGA